MKIAIIGSHGVGKTTLVSKLSKKLGLNTIPDVVVEATLQGLIKGNEETKPEEEVWLAEKHLAYENKFKSFISDKAFWDFFIYAEVLFKKHPIVSHLKFAADQHHGYDFVFYLPIEFEIENNGLRSLDSKFQKSIDTLYKEFLFTRNIQFITLKGSVETRLNEALKHISPKMIGLTT